MTYFDRADRLWQLVYTNIRNHLDCDAMTPLDCLNKAAQSWFPEAPALSPDTCGISAHIIVKSLFSSVYHRRTEEEPQCQDRPIILAQFHSDLFVLDGCRRLNKVSALGWNGIDALIIRPDMARA